MFGKSLSSAVCRASSALAPRAVSAVFPALPARLHHSIAVPSSSSLEPARGSRDGRGNRSSSSSAWGSAVLGAVCAAGLTSLAALASDGADAENTEGEDYGSLFETEEQMDAFLASLGLTDDDLQRFEDAPTDEERARILEVFTSRADGAAVTPSNVMRALTDENVNAPVTLFDAVRINNTELVDFLLSRGHKVDTVNPATGFTPLFTSVDAGNPALVKHLLANGADPNIAAPSGITPLFRALLFPDSVRTAQETVSSLLKAGADVSAVYAGGVTPLHLAIQRFCPVYAAMIIRAGADVNAPAPGSLETPLFLAARVNDQITVANLLKARAIRIDERNSDDFTPLCMAAINGQEDVAAQLVRAGADCTSLNRHSASPLFASVMMGRAGLLQTMFDEGRADPDTVVFGKPLLQWALEHNQYGSVWALMRAGANADAPAGTGTGPAAAAAAINTVAPDAPAAAAAPVTKRRTVTDLALAARDGAAHALMRAPREAIPDHPPSVLTPEEATVYFARLTGARRAADAMSGKV
jgi:ankyrin repeat protein